MRSVACLLALLPPALLAQGLPLDILRGEPIRDLDIMIVDEATGQPGAYVQCPLIRFARPTGGGVGDFFPRPELHDLRLQLDPRVDLRDEVLPTLGALVRARGADAFIVHQAELQVGRHTLRAATVRPAGLRRVELSQVVLRRPQGTLSTWDSAWLEWSAEGQLLLIPRQGGGTLPPIPLGT